MGMDIAELLSDMADRVASLASNSLGLEGGKAKKFGKDVMEMMASEWGGQNLYIPMRLTAKRSERNAKIFNEFTGDNAQMLALKYGMSVQQLYRIIKQERARRVK